MHAGQFRFSQVGVAAAAVLLAIAVLSACGDQNDGGAGSPVPDEMCADGLVPQAAAFDVDNGSFRWASCVEGAAYRYVRAVTDEAVYVLQSDGAGHGEVIALDLADGAASSPTRRSCPRWSPLRPDRSSSTG